MRVREEGEKVVRGGIEEGEAEEEERRRRGGGEERRRRGEEEERRDRGRRGRGGGGEEEKRRGGGEERRRRGGGEERRRRGEEERRRISHGRKSSLVPRPFLHVRKVSFYANIGPAYKVGYHSRDHSSSLMCEIGRHKALQLCMLCYQMQLFSM